MKRIMLAAFIVFSLFAIPTHASAYEYTGTQVMLSMNSTRMFNDAVGISAAMTYFHCPKQDRTQWFAYAGTKFIPISYFTITPVVGYAGNWEPDHDSVIFGAWSDYELFHGLVLSFDGEGIITQRVVDTYWYNQVNRRFGDFKVGAHHEAVNGQAQYGPHVGMINGPMTLEARYFAGEKGHAVRLVASWNF